MIIDCSTTLAELVAIPSVNPMGRAVSGPEFFEHRLTDYLERLFERLAIPAQRQPIAPLRDNIIVRLDAEIPPDRGGPLLLFEVHQDTVPVDGMTIEPWTPIVRDGRLYGRGACDVKGGMAAMVAAVARLAHERPKNRANIVLACTVNEENGFTGATGLTQLWKLNGASGASPSPHVDESLRDTHRVSERRDHVIFPRSPDAAVVAEPTRLDVVVAHKGVVRWRCHTHGRAAHSSRPEAGDNAIYRMARVVSALERYQRELLAAAPAHPLCGRPTLSVGTIAGGLSVNTVPDLATIEIDRRLAPGEEPDAAYRQVIDYLAAAIDDPDSSGRVSPRRDASLGVARPHDAARSITHEPPFMQSFGLADAANREIAQRLVAAVRSVRGTVSQIGVPFGTDAAAIARAGVPSVVFGPGSIEQAHTADEWISLAEVEHAAEVLYHLASDWSR
ncbi:MAG TPA: M20 family metallopeptidase [Pirellulales bacterium]